MDVASWITQLVAAGIAAAVAGAVALLWWGRINLVALADVPPEKTDTPRVSIVVPARNEERHLAAAVRGLLSQSYPDFALIVVDDRSTDGTPGILRQIALDEPRLSVVRVDALPDGWLGKNHALHRGAGRADGELILFADADVMLEHDALARAVRLLQLERADHLAVAPAVTAPTWPLAAVVNYFMMWFLLYLRPWQAPNPKSRAFTGIGAFNLLRASTYRSLDGHARIPLRPDDDIMLGKLVKRAGYRQLMATGEGIVSVEWYGSLGELARGFRKNAFAGLHYSLALTGVAAAFHVLVAVWPFVAAFTTAAPERWWYMTAAFVQMAAYAVVNPTGRSRIWLAPFYPAAAVIFVSIVLAAVVRTVRRGGIDWRGTFYPLSRLRANRV